ncbi:MAG TPA: ATP-dependent Clp protease proteolytic subunit [Candidatus Saccharimonadia bacterium]|nr:ATP-dependent Clp protease proteolytic subunit [Candidatus Saccharimonadia bacterium]
MLCPHMQKKPAVKINKPPILFAQTQKIISKIEKKLDGAFIAYWSSGNGSVCHNDVAAFFEVLKEIGPQKKLYLFIKSNGGNGQAALRIVNLLRQHTDRITALVPLECASAATMMALGADEIHMGPLAYLTAVDTSLTHALSPVDRNNYAVSVSQDELNRVLRLWRESAQANDSNPYKNLYEHVHPLVFGAIDRASSLSIKICEEILSYHLKDSKERERISKHLNSAYPSHGYPILLKEAQRVGLKVKELDSGLNDLLIDLNELYSEMGQQAITDYDEMNYHDHEILNIIEGRGAAFNYQNDKDWHYRKEERRWVPLNDQSAWNRIKMIAGKMVTKRFHIR